MKKIIKPRGKGNTLELIKISHKSSMVIVCAYARDIINIMDLAQKHKFSIPKPIIIEQHILRGERKDVLIDDAERCLAALFPYLRIQAISMSENTDEDVERWESMIKDFDKPQRLRI